MTKKASKGKRDISIWKFIITYLILMGLFMTLVGLESIKKIMDINGLYTSMIIYFTELFLKPQSCSSSPLALSRGSAARSSMSRACPWTFVSGVTALRRS